MECNATDLTLSFGLCFYFPLWLFFNFFISCLALPCPPVCKPQAIGKKCKKGDKKIEIQWGSEIRPFEIRNHSKTGHFGGWILNGK